ISLFSLQNHSILGRRLVYLPLAAVWIVVRLADWIVCDHVINEVFLARINQLMRFVGAEDECVSGHDFSHTILVTNAPLSRDDQIELPLRRMCVIWKSWISWGHSIPLQIKWMTPGQIKRGRTASECFRNSPKRRGIFPTGRL